MSTKCRPKERRNKEVKTCRRVESSNQRFSSKNDRFRSFLGLPWSLPQKSVFDHTFSTLICGATSVTRKSVLCPVLSTSSPFWRQKSASNLMVSGVKPLDCSCQAVFKTPHCYFYPVSFSHPFSNQGCSLSFQPKNQKEQKKKSDVVV